MAVHTPPVWLQTGSYSATEDRQLIRALRYSHGVVSPEMLKVTQTGTASMNVNVASGHALIDGSTSPTLQGTYVLFNDASMTVALDAANASLPRIDLVVARVQDGEFAGTVNTATIEKVTGTPAGTPTAPSAPASSITLAEILVGAGVTSVSSGNITDRRPNAKLRNAVLPVASQAARDALPLYSGLSVIRTDTGLFEYYTGSGWKTLTPDVPMMKAWGSPVDGQASPPAGTVFQRIAGYVAGAVPNASGVVAITLPGGGFANGLLSGSGGIVYNSTVAGAVLHPTSTGNSTKTLLQFVARSSTGSAVTAAIDIWYEAVGW